MVALGRMRESEVSEDQIESARQETVQAASVAEPQYVAGPRRGRKGKSRRVSAAAGPRSSSPAYSTGPEGWETWVGSQGLAMAVILIILTFDFITPQFEYSLANEKSASLFWMMSITWGIGFAVTLSNLAIQKESWSGPVSWGRAILLYMITSLSYFFFYFLAHRAQFGQRITVTGLADVIRASSVLTFGLVLFYLALLLLMIIVAITLSWRQMRNRTFWRAENWWLYLPLLAAILLVIWFKNIDVVRADIYLKEGERYRNNGQWNEAIALHEKARSIDSDEDFYYLMLALDYQLMAQDGNLTPEQRETAWQEGERIALEARQINPYNPDNTGNMGRYYFTLGQIFSRERFQDALAFFEKATILAPSNVIYHNLWAQTHYILQDYKQAIGRLQTSVSIDPNYSPSWLLLGDTYAAMGDIDKALKAHTEALAINSAGGGDGFAGFADQFLDQRLNFYISAGRTDDIIAVLEQVALERPDVPQVQQAIGRAYSLAGQQDKAALYFEQAQALGDQSPTTLRNLANHYLASNSYDQAIPAYQSLLEGNPADVEAHSALAYIYAQQGRLDEAIQHNQQVLQQIPEDYDSLKNLAILYQQKGQLQEALEFAKRAQAAASETEKPSWDQLIANLESQLATSN
jgi:tetratricopeptide (TPR) repeat protein